MSYRKGIVHSMTKVGLMLVLTLVLWQHTTHGIPLFEKIVDCGPSVPEYPCRNGTITINVNPNVCEDRVVCRRNLGQSCQIFGDVSTCAEGLVCSCDRCREMLTICGKKLRSPFNMPKRMKPIMPENEFWDAKYKFNY